MKSVSTCNFIIFTIRHIYLQTSSPSHLNICWASVIGAQLSQRFPYEAANNLLWVHDTRGTAITYGRERVSWSLLASSTYTAPPLVSAWQTGREVCWRSVKLSWPQLLRRHDCCNAGGFFLLISISIVTKIPAQGGPEGWSHWIWTVCVIAGNDLHSSGRLEISFFSGTRNLPTNVIERTPFFFFSLSLSSLQEMTMMISKDTATLGSQLSHWGDLLSVSRRRCSAWFTQGKPHAHTHTSNHTYSQRIVHK